MNLDEVTTYPKFKEIFKLIINNPLLTANDDEIGEKGLIDWLKKEGPKISYKSYKIADYQIAINILCENEILSKKFSGQRVILRPTRKYFILKKELISNKKISRKNINELKDQKKKSPDRLLTESPPISYSHFLYYKISQYQDRNSEIIKYCPLFFNLLCNLLSDEKFDWHSRILISSALSYFANEKDVIPDHLENGYVDDLFVAVHTIQLLIDRFGINLFVKYWDYNENLESIIKEVKEKSEEILIEKQIDSLNLNGINDFIFSNLEEYSGIYSSAIANSVNNKRLLIGIAVILLKKIKDDSNLSYKYPQVKLKVNKLGDASEIYRYINIIKKKETVNKNESREVTIDQNICKNISYYNLLLSRCNNYSGQNVDLVKKIPLLYKLCCNISVDNFTPWSIKVMVNTAIAYFILEDDITPDNQDFGLFDDLFIMLYVLKEIKNDHMPEIISKNWFFAENIFHLIDSYYSIAYSIVYDKACEILQKVGLHKFRTLKIEGSEYELQKRMTKIKKEKSELFTLNLMLCREIFRNVPHFANISEMSNFVLQNSNYEDFHNIINIVKKYHYADYKKQNLINNDEEIELMILDARIKALFD